MKGWMKMSAKTATGLVTYAKAQLNKPYWYGCFGNKPTAELLQYKAFTQYSYPKFGSYTPARMPKFRAQIGKFDRVHDCVGLIKGYLWSPDLNTPPKYNAAQDVSADGMRGKCAVKGLIGTLPETPGALVFFNGHVGVYIGGGQVIEARGSDYGVAQTALKSRPWTSWGLCPWIEYGKPALPAEHTKRPAQQAQTNAAEKCDSCGQDVVFSEYTVKPGDSPRRIARQLLGSELRYKELLELNGLKEGVVIHPGQKIKIPKK